MNYTCQKCNYTTDRKANFHLHNTTQKHKNNVEHDIKPDEQTHRNNVEHDNKHDNKPDEQKHEVNGVNSCCVQIRNIFLQEKLKERDMLIADKDDSHNQLMTEKERIIKILENELASYKSIVNGAGGLASESMSIMSHIVKNYKDAPPLKIYDDYKKLNMDQEDYVEQLCYYYRNDMFIKYVSECIIDEFKKNDPSQQSFWTSDASRLTYIIKELLKDDTSNWLVDKNGVKIRQYIIQPLLKQIRKEITTHVESIDIYDPNINLEEYTENFQTAHKVINNIDNGSLERNILKSITPYFYMDKKQLKNLEKDHAKKEGSKKVEVEVITDVKEVEEVEEVKDVKEVDDVKDGKDVKDVEDVKDVKNVKDGKGIKEVKGIKGIGDVKGIKEVKKIGAVKDVVEAKDVGEIREITKEEFKDVKKKDVIKKVEVKEVKSGKEIKDIPKVKAVTKIELVNDTHIFVKKQLKN